MPDVLELRRRWDVDERFVLPALQYVVVNGDVDHDTIDVTNVYYDTRDHDLSAHGIELRRGDGDCETGWQLKVPADGGRRNGSYGA
jgi:inorganic triphosphatase YgiF